MKYLFFDTETNDKPLSHAAPATDVNNWPRIAEIGWVIYDEAEQEISSRCFFIKPDGWKMTAGAQAVHGYSQEMLMEKGIPLQEALTLFKQDGNDCTAFIAHNIKFDRNVIDCEYFRFDGTKGPYHRPDVKQYCTMMASTAFCRLPQKGKRGGFKWPKLEELYFKLFNTEMGDAHNAADDARNCAKCFFELRRQLVHGSMVLKEVASEETTKLTANDYYSDLADLEMYEKVKFSVMPKEWNAIAVSQQGISTGAICFSIPEKADRWIPKSQLRVSRKNENAEPQIYLANWLAGRI